MKTKFLKIFATILACVTLAFGAAACGHEHSYVEKITAPTCTEQGYTTYTCDCGDVYVDNSVTALGHEFTNYASNNDATCIQDGTETAMCNHTGCQKKDTRTDENSLLGHSFIDYISNNDATCTQDGTETAMCNHTGCEEQETRTDIDSAGHKYNMTVNKRTCVSNMEIVYTCSNCFHTYTDNGENLSISLQYTGVDGAIINDYGYFTRHYDVSISGGFGKTLLKFELFVNENSASPASVVDFCETNGYSITFRGYTYELDKYVVKVTAKDEGGNIVFYTFKIGDLSVLDSQILKGECEKVEAVNDVAYINLYGFGKYVCKDCQAITYRDKEGKLLEVANLQLSNDKSTVMTCHNVDTAEILIVPDTVTNFADDHLFVYCDNLKYVLFSSNAIDLNLQGAPIKHMYIPANITVRMPDCKSLKTVIWADGVTKIDQYGIYNGCVGRTLAYSSIQSIVIPVSVSTILDDVFNNATKLTTVYYMGTAKDWDNIDIGKDGNIYLTEAMRYYYSESEPPLDANGTAYDGNYWHYVDGVPTVWVYTNENAL